MTDQKLFTGTFERDPDIDNLIAFLNRAPPSRYQETVGEVFGYDSNGLDNEGNNIVFPASLNKVRDAIKLDPYANVSDFKTKSLIKLLIAYQNGGAVDGTFDPSKLDISLLNAQINLLKQKGITKGKDVSGTISKSQGFVKAVLEKASDKKTTDLLKTGKLLLSTFFGSSSSFLGTDFKNYLSYLKVNAPSEYDQFLDKLRVYWTLKLKEKDKTATKEEIDQRKLYDLEFSQKHYSKQETKFSLLGMTKGLTNVDVGQIAQVGKKKGGEMRGGTIVDDLYPDQLNRSALIENIHNGGYAIDKSVLEKAEIFNALMNNTVAEQKKWYQQISFMKITSVVLLTTVFVIISINILFYLVGVTLAIVLLYMFYVKPEFSILKQAYIITFAFAANWLIPLYYFIYKL